MSDHDMDDVRIDLAALARAVLSRWLRILLVTAALVGATFVILLFMPRMYESSASLLIAPRENAFMRTVEGGSAGPAGPAALESLVSSQIELIKSRDTLMVAIDEQNLRSVPELTGAGASPMALVMRLFGRAQPAANLDETVLANLNERLTVMRERDSAIVSIYVRTENPELSARIANAIANTHVRRRAGLSLSDTAEASAWLEQEIAKLRTRVNEAETAVADYKVGKDLFVGPNNTRLVDQQHRHPDHVRPGAQEQRRLARDPDPGPSGLGPVARRRAGRAQLDGGAAALPEQGAITGPARSALGDPARQSPHRSRPQGPDRRDRRPDRLRGPAGGLRARGGGPDRGRPRNVPAR
jgi:hypothetical protein